MNICLEDKKWAEETLKKLTDKVAKTAITQRDRIPYKIIDGKYENVFLKDPCWWTNGFYGGMLWLLYERTKNEEFLKTARSQEALLDKALYENFARHDHDVGFIWGLTSKASYLLTGDEKSKERVFTAAASLASRANIRAGFIRAWNHERSFSIIDCLMNLPILYWASKELGDDRFSYIAQMHADMTLKYHVREDGSVAHIVDHLEDSTDIKGTLGGQGYKEGSSWSRGQAWAVYGLYLSYLHTGEKKYLDGAIKTADYFLSEVEKTNYKTLTDFRAPKEPVYYDNSAGACAACGMIEIYKATNNKKYLDGAIKILKAMEEDCIFDDSDESIVQNCMEAYFTGNELHLVYADFFLCEALLKLTGSEFNIW